MRSSKNAEPRESDPPEASALVEAVARAGRDEATLAELREIYRLAETGPASPGGVCLGGGACCKFDRAAHRLYVSTAELALLASAAPPAPDRARRGRCPYQVGPRCTARDRRPLGCRIFFCNAAPVRMEAEYERHHRAIRELHHYRGFPYLYVELTSALTQLFCS